MTRAGISLRMATVFGLLFAITGFTVQAAAPATAFTVLDIGERSLDDSPALAVLFSEPLRTNQRYDAYITVTNDKGAVVNGSWVQGDNKRLLYFPHIEPQQTYNVLVRRGLPSASGATLAEAVEKQIKTRPMPPAYGFASRGSVLPARLSDGLPVMTVNVPEVDVQFLRVRDSKLPEFINRYLLESRQSRWELQNLTPLLESVYLMRFTAGAKPNARMVSNLPVEDIKELKQPGVYVAVMTRPGDFGYNAERITYFYVSDIGLHARLYPGGMQIYASSLETSRALMGVTLDLYDNQGKSIERVQSDAAGLARFVGRGQPGQVLVARSANHLSVLAFRDPALDLSEFDVAGPAQSALEAYVYADRDLYRPGETAQVSILLRDSDGRPIAAAQPLRATLKRADGKEMGSFTWQPQQRGFYSQSLAIPSDAQTGLWTLEVRADPAAKQPNGLLRFHIEEFLPERMKLDLKSATPQVRHDEELRIDVEGAYLYGAPAGGNRFTATLNVRRDRSPIATLPGFVFGDSDDDKISRREEISDTTLDDKGHTKIELRPFTERPRSPMQVRITGSVFESGGRPVTRTLAQTVWPATAMIGVRPVWTGDYAPHDSLARFEVVRATPDGKLLAAKSLDVKVIREDRNYYWSYDEQRGWHNEFSEAQYPVYSQSLSIAAGGRVALAVPVEYGSYRVEIQDPENGLTTRYRFYAGWDWREPGKRSARPDRVVLKLDKPAYRAGEIARLTILPPHAGEAVVLVESDRALWSTRVSLAANGGIVNIPVSKDWNRHDLYISAVVFRPATAKDKVTPNRAMGVVHLPLDRADRKLAMTVDAPKKMRPETALKVKLKLPDVRGQQALVTVAAVDVGILNITDFKTPDPFAYFFAKRRYGVESYDLYSKVIENMRGARARLRFGGDADSSGLRKDKRAKAEVKTVALFSGPVKVGPNGEAEVSLPVPDFNGALRVMAVAASDDRFGSAETEVIVTAPIVAEIAVPRFLGAGDKSTLTLDLQNVSGQKQNFALKLAAANPLVLAPVSTQVVLENQQKTILRYEIAADQAFGVGRLDLAIVGQGVALKRHWELGVRPAWPGERRVSQKALARGESLAIPEASSADLMDKTAEVQLMVSSLPPINIRSAVQNLLHYPYGCLEQTTSAAYPHLYVDEAKAAEFGLKPLSSKERSERVEKAIARIATMQLASGGFGLWGSSSPEETWLTPYATGFLLDAREQGFAVPDSLLNRALDNLARRLQAGGGLPTRDRYSDSPTHLSFAANAYAGYILARVQRAPLGTLRTLHDHQRVQAESGLPLVHLGLALKLQGDEKRGLEAIAEGVKKARRERWYLGDYGSDVRDNGLMYALLVRHGIQVEGKDRLLFTLGSDLANRPYLSTQERFAVFMAGHNALQNAGQPWSGTLRAGGKEEKIDGKRRLVRTFPIADVRRGIGFTNTTAQTLYTEVEVTGYPKSTPKPKLDEINIVRALYTPDGKPVGDRALKVGELLLAHLRVESNKIIEDALVVDLLPAGLEVENLNLSQGESLRDMKINAVNPIEAMQSNQIKHQEYRDDRFVAAVRLGGYGTVNLFYLVRVVSPGQYTVPPPFVEDMYRPDRRAIGVAPGLLRIENSAR